MRLALPRLVLPLAALMIAAACGPNRNDGPEAEQAPASAQTTQGTEGTVTPAAPPAAVAPQGDPAAPPARAPQGRTVEQSPVPGRSAQAAERTAPRAPRPPAPPAAPDPAQDDRTTGSAPVETAAAAERTTPRPAPVRMLSIPENTPLRLSLQTALGSDTSAVEDRVSARVVDDVVVEGETVIPEGSRVDGRVTYVQPSGKVKGRAGLTVRFHTLTVGSRAYDITTEPVRREAEGSKAKDARNIGIGAGAGAVIGGIIGGRKGAGIGAAVGGAGGTGVVLATKGEEVRLAAGTPITTRLADALVVELRGGR